LVKNSKHLTDTYSSHPEYYNFSNEEEGQALNFYEYGLQNSLGFRVIKIWMALQQIGSNGYKKMIGQDIELSKLLFELVKNHQELEAITQSLSITTFRYAPLQDLSEESTKRENFLNTLNETLLDNLQQGGEVFLSNTIIQDKYCLRGCIVNSGPQ
jgi:glutamate/tyrosine decarboxylase-like PLP-dependent enzyme